MSKRYPGGIIRKTPQTPSQTSAQGIWDMTSVTQAVKENTWPIAGVPDPISKSLRFRSSAGAYLNRTPASAGNRKTWTWSGWVKRGTLGTNQSLFTCYFANNDTSYLTISFTSDNLNIGLWNTSILYTSAVYRDPSAWYHIVLAIDTTQATASDRAKLYVNGTQVTAFGSTGYPAQNTDLAVNSAAAHYISTYDGTNYKFDGYMTEVYLIDGQALTPSSFGNTNDQTGVWQPIAYTGTYGTNGFYLPFSNTASTATLGYDYSGNSNNWTPNNISLTSGSTYDSMVDVPTQWIPYNTAGDTGALFRGNYGVFNPLNKFSSTTITNGNLLVTNGSSGDGWSTTGSTFAFPQTGKWYAEFTIVNRPFSGSTGIGIVPSNISFVNQSGDSARFAWGRVYFDNSGIIGPSNASVQNTTQAPTYTTGDIISVAFDSDNGTVWWAKNGTWTNSGNPATGTNPAYSGLTATAYPMGFVITSEGYSSSQIAGNWGQLPFSYTPPAGFKTLCTTNLPTPTIGATAATTANKYMDATLYTGAGNVSTSITNAGGFQPDFVWTKARSIGYNHYLYDSVRGTGTGASLYSDNTNAEGTFSSNGNLSAFNSNGWTIGTTAGTNALNASGQTFVGWQWRASNATAVTNTAGSITSTVSANTTAGFSVVTYTGNGTSGATVGHGLGVTPSMVILKQRDGASNWQVKHVSLNANQNLILNSTAAVDTAPGSGYISAISSTTLTLLNGGSAITNVNANNGTYVAYCFAQVAGYSAFGSYTGNGSSDGPFIFTGFRPRFILTKATSFSTASTVWTIWDTTRSPYNAAVLELYPNSSSAESTDSSGIDILSNGFKPRRNSEYANSNGQTYIYMAVAESPFKFALAR